MGTEQDKAAQAATKADQAVASADTANAQADAAVAEANEAADNAAYPLTGGAFTPIPPADRPTFFQKAEEKLGLTKPKVPEVSHAIAVTSNDDGTRTVTFTDRNGAVKTAVVPPSPMLATLRDTMDRWWADIEGAAHSYAQKLKLAGQ